MRTHRKKFAAATILSLLCLCFLPARADYKPYDWVITIQMEEMPDQLAYANSTLAPIVEAHMSYARADSSDKTEYETIWYGNGKAYGLERYDDLGIGTGQGVVVQVVQAATNPSQSEYTAAANAILRVLLEVRTSRNVFQMVVVPDQSYLPITTALAGEHYQPFESMVERPYKISAPIFMEDQSAVHKQTLCYGPTSRGNLR